MTSLAGTAPRPVLDHGQALARLAMRGTGVVLLFALGLGYWAARMPIAGAVVAPGQFVVDSSVKKVQHPTGGVVGTLDVREGQVVQAGQLLVRLDETVLRATLRGVSKKIDELQARAARLDAERLGFAGLTFPAVLLERAGEPEMAQILNTERSLYDARKASHFLRKQRLNERVGQFRKEIESFEADLSAKRQLSAITEKELAGLRDLSSRRLISTQRINAVERDSVSLTGQQAQIQASIAQSAGKVVETEVQIVSLDDELRAETTKELREAQAELAQQEEKRVAAVDQLTRVEIRAPIAGQVQQLAVHAIGAVVTPAEPMMLIVPLHDKLELEVRVQPHDIDQLHLAQPSTVRILSSNSRTTPQLEGEVTRISADVSKDQQTGAMFYLVRVGVAPAEIAKLENLKLQPGMQAEALIKTGERTTLEYLLKPLLEQMGRAMRER